MPEADAQYRRRRRASVKTGGRIVQEAQATRGGVRRISDLFGISVDTAARYLRVHDPASISDDDVR